VRLGDMEQHRREILFYHRLVIKLRSKNFHLYFSLKNCD
jgi:hypothetical protein